ncbi:exported hypothetical protein [Gammaproteobacteria bacterium]
MKALRLSFYLLLYLLGLSLIASTSVLAKDNIDGLDPLSANMETATQPKTITLNATVRDFCGNGFGTAKCPQGYVPHPDFENVVADDRGVVATVLGTDGTPVPIATFPTKTVKSVASFNQWYHDTPGINMTTTIPLILTETSAGSGVYVYDNSSFFPIDGKLLGNEGQSHNFSFSLDLHTTFKYATGQTFNFSGDDDVWVFINNKLVIDLGGVHGAESASVNLNTLGLTAGQNYKFDIFFAERHTSASNFKFQTSIVFDAPITQNQTIGAISFTPTTLLVGGTTAVSATATSGLAVSFSSTTTSVCTVNGNTVTGITAGVCAIAADQAGNTSYNPAPRVTQNITVGKGNQSIIFGTAPTIMVGGTGTISATGGASGNAVTFTSQTTNICSTGGANGATVTGVTAGVCVIAANQAGNANYNAAPQETKSITIVGKTNQTIGAITFNPAILIVGGATTVSATATSGLAVSFNSITTSICTVNGSTVTGIATGICTIAADQAGNGSVNPAQQVTQNITVGKGNQVITLGAIPAIAIGRTELISATGGASGNAVTFSSQTTSVCTTGGTDGATVTGITVGTCVIAANQAGNANYNAAPQVTKSVNVIAKTNQTISAITFNPTTLMVDGTTTASATASSELEVSFRSITPTICTVRGIITDGEIISGATIAGVAAGTCTIAANQAGNAIYSSAQEVTRSITVSKGNQVIAFGAIPTIVVGDIKKITATGGRSGNVVTFASQTTSVCTTSGTNGATVTGVTAGTCVITANQAGNANYNAAPEATKSITIKGKTQTIGTITFNPTTLAIGGTTTVNATATSGLDVSFSSTTPDVCTVTGNTVTDLVAGTCIVAANQAGNTIYSPAPRKLKSITVLKRTQSIGDITFNPTTLAIGGTTTVSATATSGLEVSFSSMTPAVCTVTGKTVTDLVAGTCVVAANQAGNATYNPATQKTKGITTLKRSQSIGTITFNPATLDVGGTTTVSATATSGLEVSFSSMTPTVCSVTGNTVTDLVAGKCVVAANQAGNATYNPATQKISSITTLKRSQTIGIISFNPITLAVGGTSTVSATASSGLSVSFNSTTPSTCSVIGNTVRGITVGDCIVAANQAGNATYDAAPQKTRNVIVRKGNQKIDAISFNPATLTIGGTTTVSATATSNLPVSFSSTTSSVCTVNGETVTGVAAGTCTVVANQAGDSNWNAATSVKKDIAVSSIQASCRAINESLPNTQSGVYTIDPDGVGPIAPFQVYCDMDSDGGGWTLVAKLFELTMSIDAVGIDNLLTNAQPNAGEESKLADVTINALGYLKVRVIPSSAPTFTPFFFQPGVQIWDFAPNGSGNLNGIPTCNDAALTVNCITRMGVIDRGYAGYRNWNETENHAFVLNHGGNLGYAGRAPYALDSSISATVWVR